MSYWPAVGATPLWTFGGVLAGIIGFIFIIVLFKYGWLWIQAFASGAHISIANLVGMSLRRINARTIVESKIGATKAGINVTTDALETH